MSEVSAGEKNLLREWIHWIMGGLIVWGLLLGLGTYLYDSGIFANATRLEPGTQVTVGLTSKDPPGPRVPVDVKRRTGTEEREAILRGIIISTCTVVFVSFWWAMLISRERRLNRLAASKV